jgi:hypothetical protein
MQGTKDMIHLCIGSSMLPTFGKINMIKITKKKDYKIGDIISLKTHDGKYHCHRIMTMDKFVSTKGDNLDQQKYEIDVPMKNIEGIVKLVWRIYG